MGNIDYKAKFEKAMEDIAKIRKTNKDNTELVEFIDFNYPELKEKPNDRMMKALLEFLGDFPYEIKAAEGVTVGELIVWVEEEVKPKLDSMLNNQPEPAAENKQVSKKVQDDIDMVDCCRIAVEGFKNWAETARPSKCFNFDNKLISPDSVLKWLSSLKRRWQWRPTEEEMSAIYRMVYIDGCDDEFEKPLRHLYQDLKREFFDGVSIENMPWNKQPESITEKNTKEK